MHRRTTLAVVGVAALAGAMLYATPGAYAAADHTPPKLTAVAGFVVGSQITDYDAGGGLGPNAYTSVPEIVKWTGSDASGICGYDVDADYPGIDPERILTNTMSVSYRSALTNYDGSYGGGALTQDGWLVTAHDCAGNSTTVLVGRQPEVFQENGTSVTFSDDLTFTYSGAWTNSTCACASGGKQRYTAAKNASVTIKGSFDRDNYLGLVMAQGPKRGKAAVYLDGKKLTTVNTYAKANVNRTVVFSKWLDAGRHTLKLVNLATRGHSRIDLDAVLRG